MDGGKALGESTAAKGEKHGELKKTQKLVAVQFQIGGQYVVDAVISFGGIGSHVTITENSSRSR